MRHSTRLAVAAGWLLLAAPVSAQFFSYGSGCGNPTPLLRPAPASLLDSGLPYTMRCWNAPVGAPGFLAFSLVDTSPGIPLAPYGMAGCELYNGADITVLMPSLGSYAEGTIPMPVWPCGLAIYAQAAMLDPSANATGIAWSSGAKLVLDGFTDSIEHRASSANVTANWTALDHDSINGEPDAVFLVDGYGSSGGGGIGVWFNETIERWTVFNQDTSPMSTNRPFTVALPNSRAHAFRWHASAANITGNLTTIDHPALNGNPDAHLHVTKLYESGSGLAGYQTSAIGVWYDNSSLRWTVFNENGQPMSAAARFQLVVADDELENRLESFVYTHTGGSTSLIYLDHPLLNDNPYVRVLVTHQWGPGGGLGVYNRGPTTAGYESLIYHRWALVNQGAQIPPGASFNILVLATNARPRCWTHTASSNNLNGVGTTISGSSNPGSRFFVTQNWNPTGGTGVYNDHELRVSFVTFPQIYWQISNADGAAIPVGAAFNVLRPNSDADAFTLIATSSNTTNHEVAVQHPLLDQTPHALAFVQQSNGTANPHPVGLRYSATQGIWLLRNLDGAPMPLGVSYQVLIASPQLAPTLGTFSHVATAANRSTSGNATHLSHPAIDGRPDAKVFVTQKGDVVNDNTIGVYFSSVTNRWAIYNNAFQSLTIGAEFNVLFELDCP